MPTGVAAADGVLAVADAWNHRVLIWHGYPRASNQPADVVLGQADFAGGLANRGADAPGAGHAELVLWRDHRRWAAVRRRYRQPARADVGPRCPERNGAPADLVLGQADFTCRDENAGAEHRRCAACAGRMRSSSPDGALMVADAGNNRVMVWRALPQANGAPCDFVLGQAGPTHQEYNAAAYYPTAATVNMPYGLARARATSSSSPIPPIRG